MALPQITLLSLSPSLSLSIYRSIFVTNCLSLHFCLCFSVWFYISICLFVLSLRLVSFFVMYLMSMKLCLYQLKMELKWNYVNINQKLNENETKQILSFLVCLFLVKWKTPELGRKTWPTRSAPTSRPRTRSSGRTSISGKLWKRWFNLYLFANKFYCTRINVRSILTFEYWIRFGGQVFRLG